MHDEVRRLFHELADLSPAQRERYFQEHQVPADVRAEVETLLSCDSGSDHFLIASVAACAAQLLDETRKVSERRRCGPYRLLRLLGHGGMGSVYLGERADGEVEQRAAIKLLRYGSDEPAFRERFLRERQILATLNHPAIARLLDAGRTAGGQPYLAMDYIDGTPIDEYSEKLDLRGKLGLFRQVCDAVSYAHRNLIVHRDLKPSNILVDRDGRPKLLDFGIAKILDSDQDQPLERTATVFQALTPQYASPEQVRGEAITTASDVYSLGVVLYRLLTGRLPYEFPALTPTAIEHAVCESEPAPPHVTEDLDNIVLMALRKEPARRYLSVQHLAEDIDRALLDRPVLARPDTIRYRTAKFVRRNRFSLCLGTLALAATIGGSAVAIYQGRLAQRRFEDVRKLAHTFVFDLHDEIANLEGSTKAREMMVRTGLEYLDNLARNAGGDLDLQREIAAGYMKIGDAEGYPTKPNLGRIGDALASYRKAGAIYRRIAAKNSAYEPDLAEYYVRFAGLVRFTNNLAQARELSESAIETFDRVRARRRFDEQLEISYIGAWCKLGDIDEDQGHYRRAWAEFSRCGELAREQLKRKRDRPALSALAGAAERIGTAARELGLLTEALRAFDEDESLLGELLAAEPLNPAWHRRQALVEQFRSTVYYDDRYPNLGDPARALESARRYLAAAEEMVRSDPNNASAKFSRAVALNRVSYPLGEFDANAAVRMARDSVRMFDQLIASGKANHLIVSGRAQALERLAEAQLKAHRVAEAHRSAESALAAERSIAAKSANGWEERMDLAQLLILDGQTSAASGSFERAEELLKEGREEASEIAKRKELTSLIPLAHAEEALGAFYIHRRRVGEARACYQRLLELWQRFPEANEYVDRQKAAAGRLLASLH